MKSNKNIETIILGGGCYWCMEAIFKKFQGVINVIPGFSGSKTQSPCYEDLLLGRNGAAEVIKITYDKTSTSLENILKFFFTIHNPTSLNRTGKENKTKYRSVIFYKNESERLVAEDFISKLNNSTYHDKITTTIQPLTDFHKAPEEHQNYYENNKNKPYCKTVINPKLDKLKKEIID